MSIDPDTGVVTNGAGYMFGIGTAGWGTGGTGGNDGAGGEMRLGNLEGDPADSGTIQQFMSTGFGARMESRVVPRGGRDR